MAIKEAMYERDLGRCRYCGVMLELWQATTDHVVPKKEGGRSTKDNTVTACPRCNAVKSDRTLQEAGMRLWSLEEFEALDSIEDSIYAARLLGGMYLESLAEMLPDIPEGHRGKRLREEKE